eukprot:CAMPEP_0170588770 /NCGR_PEP_ID=MMETSP0224-20130122/11007_1 /TAXON_ID=285029 /ORGANISM="Togula jolla, Strain CCCM 725" /LENGTH=89 /DNA_ID=CAMNT_0010912509 /DNA_START=283 /DNA_END=552 /DNA_ORIENTATION=-
MASRQSGASFIRSTVSMPPTIFPKASLTTGTLNNVFAIRVAAAIFTPAFLSTSRGHVVLRRPPASALPGNAARTARDTQHPKLVPKTKN